MIRQRGQLLAAVAAAAALALTGCGASGDSAQAPAVNKGENAGAGAPAPEAKPGEAQPDQAQPGNAAPAQQRREDRSIVYTGDLTVRVDDVNQAATRAGALADSAGGFVAGDKRAINEKQSEAHLTLRVPADRFISTVDGLAKLGDEESRGISTEDVTQQVVDLDAQIASQKASVDRTRALLARAQSIGEIVSIEAELAKRESALATLEARKRRLADLSALSTVTAHLLARTADAAAAPTKRAPSFLAGLNAGWRGLVASTNVLLAVLGLLLPFAAAVGLPAGLAWWLVRRRRAALIRHRQAIAEPGISPAAQ